MKKNLLTLLGVVVFLSAFNLKAQDLVMSPEMIATAVHHEVVGPLRDMPALTAEEIEALAEEEARVKRNEDLQYRNYPFYEQYKLDGPDPAHGSQRWVPTKASPALSRTGADKHLIPILRTTTVLQAPTITCKPSM